MKTIGIRREDKDRWEARVPLVPGDVARLVREASIPFRVQRSSLRVFADEEYGRAGACLDDEVRGCGVVMAVKEIPRRFFERRGTYVFFSHTIKGQPHNMGMLRRMMELECQLVDYERITDERGARLVSFSRFAGLAGAVDTLWALGLRLEREGLRPNPFAGLRQTRRYRTLAAALAGVGDAGRAIAREGLPAELCPFVVGISGYGNVARGALEVLGALGARDVQPGALAGLFRGAPQRHAAHAVVFRERDTVAPRQAAAPFSLEEYYRSPERYEGRFARWLPRLAVLINCVYWDARYPRLVTRDDVRGLYGSGRAPRLRVIGDLSCDIEGSVEITVKETHLDAPVYTYDAASGAVADGVGGAGPVVLAVGNLPCELPRDASAAFSAALAPYVPALARADFSVPFGRLDLPPEVRRAVILQRGELTPGHAYMRRFV